MDKTQSYCYELQALRYWIRDLDIELRRSTNPDPADEDFLLQVTLCFDNLLAEYKKAYDPNSNMIEPQVFEKEFHYPDPNLGEDLRPLFPTSKHETEKVQFLIDSGQWTKMGVLDEFMTYLQDPNWPIAHTVIEFLHSLKDKKPLVEPLKGALREALLTGDDFWGHNLLNIVVHDLSQNETEDLKEELIDWSRSDLFSSIEALCILGKFSLISKDQLNNRANNMLSALDTWKKDLEDLVR